MNDTAYFYEVFYIGKQHCSKNIYFILDMVGIFDYVVLCLIPMILENNKIQLYRNTVRLFKCKTYQCLHIVL